jgi:hypothetical protein
LKETGVGAGDGCNFIGAANTGIVKTTFNQISDRFFICLFDIQMKNTGFK